jgi:LPXTG-motif cell wall-anchored protein
MQAGRWERNGTDTQMFELEVLLIQTIPLHRLTLLPAPGFVTSVTDLLPIVGLALVALVAGFILGRRRKS